MATYTHRNLVTANLGDYNEPVLRVFGISDLHLSFTTNKAMDVFGPQWFEHWKRLEENWRQLVQPEDLVLIPGDISWAMTFAQAQQDLEWLQDLPGIKVLSRGNHDYWWQSIGKMRTQWPGLNFIQNDAFTIEDVSVCATRGWILPGASDFTAQDEKIYNREVMRFKLALAAIPKTAKRRIAMFHYPPFNTGESAFTELMQQTGIDLCLFGHLHGLKPNQWPTNNLNGLECRLISADYLDFCPLLLPV